MQNWICYNKFNEYKRTDDRKYIQNLISNQRIRTLFGECYDSS